MYSRVFEQFEMISQKESIKKARYVLCNNPASEKFAWDQTDGGFSFS